MSYAELKDRVRYFREVGIENPVVITDRIFRVTQFDLLYSLPNDRDLKAKPKAWQAVYKQITDILAKE